MFGIKRKNNSETAKSSEIISENSDYKILSESEYFDAKFYLETYTDVKNAGMDPLEHYVIFGWKEGRNPSKEFNVSLFEKFNGKKDCNPLVYYELHKNDEDLIGPESPKYLYETSESAENVVNNILGAGFPLKTRPCTREKRRLNIIFNGFKKDEFYGGKATALLLAVIYVNTYNLDLRIIADNPEKDILDDFLNLYNVSKPQKTEYFNQCDNEALEVSDKDDFLCTMWVNAKTVLDTPEITGKIFYIMQEVETFFYDHGDFHYLCRKALTDSRIIPIVNSKFLYDYLVNDGYENVKKNGIYFEPVFSEKLLSPDKNAFEKKEKYNLFFYGRPGHQRNIFCFALSALNYAFNKGKLNPDEWNVIVAGDNTVPDFRFDRMVKTVRTGKMNWKEYCDFMKTVDMCFSLMYTPHPSYPPLDAVTAGAVSVTNRFKNKNDLSCYSDNIVMADLDADSIAEALEKGAEIVKNPEKRRENYLNSHTAGNWQDAFAKSVIHMHGFVGED